MHTHTVYRPAAVGKRRTSGLTLLELVVVLAVLVVLAGMLVPIISGLGYQTNAATNATVVDEVTRAVRTYHARFDAQPDRWDSLLTSTGTLFSKLHPGLVGGSPSDPARTIADPTALELDAQQSESLRLAGITQLYDADDSQSANLAHVTLRIVANGGKVAQLSTSTGAARIMQDATAVGQSNASYHEDNEFILLGLGGNSALRGTVATEVPLIQSADPLHNYARVICIYMIPRTGAAAEEVFPAVFVGCILPDGTSRTDNLESYNNTRSDGG
jgi:type II secretory pathway pseudopilin PulG